MPRHNGWFGQKHSRSVIMPTNNKKLDVSRVLASLLQVFKATPADKIDALNDALDIYTDEPDQWNREDRGAAMHNVNTGPTESASGSGGEKMVNDYSKDLKDGNSITAAYTALAE